jgi:hypothetical protein
LINTPHKKIYLSPPHLNGEEIDFIKDAIDSNWIAPLGPHVDAFESEVANYIGVKQAAALSSTSLSKASTWGPRGAIQLESIASFIKSISSPFRCGGDKYIFL